MQTAAASGIKIKHVRRNPLNSWEDEQTAAHVAAAEPNWDDVVGERWLVVTGEVRGQEELQDVHCRGEMDVVLSKPPVSCRFFDQIVPGLNHHCASFSQQQFLFNCLSNLSTCASLCWGSWTDTGYFCLTAKPKRVQCPSEEFIDYRAAEILMSTYKQGAAVQAESFVLRSSSDFNLLPSLWF